MHWLGFSARVSSAAVSAVSPVVLCIGLLGNLFGGAAHAQAAPAARPPPVAAGVASAGLASTPPIAAGALVRLSGPTRFTGPFDVAKLRGKPTLVMVWSTECLVCKSKMVDLRQAALDKKINVVLVSRDKSQKVLYDYLDVVRTMALAGKDAQVHLWSGAPGYTDNFGGSLDKLPVTFLIDKQGKLVERIEGRFDTGLVERAAKL